MKVLNPAKSVIGPADKIVVPPSGIIAGVCARTDSARPDGVYDPPAGIDKGRIFGVLGFEPSKAFFVDFSHSLNTPSVIFAGKLAMIVGTPSVE